MGGGVYSSWPFTLRPQLQQIHLMYSLSVGATILDFLHWAICRWDVWRETKGRYFHLCTLTVLLIATSWWGFRIEILSVRVSGTSALTWWSLTTSARGFRHFSLAWFCFLSSPISWRWDPNILTPLPPPPPPPDHSFVSTAPNWKQMVANPSQSTSCYGEQWPEPSGGHVC